MHKSYASSFVWYALLIQEIKPKLIKFANRLIEKAIVAKVAALYC